MREAAHQRTERQVELGSLSHRFTSRSRAHAVIYLEDRSFFVDLQEEGSTVIGRSEEADVQLPTPTMSRQHFELRWVDDRLTVKDCDSTNGTLLNGVRLEEETLLKGGDQITAGDALVVVGVSSPQAPLQCIRPTEVFEERLGAVLLRASRLGRMVALVRVRIQGPLEQAAPGITKVLGALPGRANVRAIGPLDFHVAIESAVEQVRPICASLAADSSAPGPQLAFGVAIFPAEAQDLASLVRAADSAFDRGPRPEETPPSGPVAVDPATQRVFALVDRVARSNGTVLIVGETGVGKELVARGIHDGSARAAGPFVPVNCGAIPSSMLASEFFGHERGAFTGAQGRRAGLFETASGGTLFLDEIGEIPLADQAHLLRAIESRSITRLGGTERISLDIRILAATNRNLRELVQLGRFRQDLLYRLDVLTIVVPALRDRRGDIAPLVERFLAERARAGAEAPLLSVGAISVLEQYNWPGNVRELRNVIERLALLSEGPEISELEAADMLYGEALPGVDLHAETDLKTLLSTVEHAAIERALRGCGGNQTLAAQKLGISRRTLIYRMRTHGIPGPRTG